MFDFCYAAGTLARREGVRFFRQRSRIIGAFGTPLVFWLLIGAGFDSLEWLVPGTLVMILLFSSIFSTISIIEDRREGFLQGVLVAPVPRSAIVLGKVMGGAGVALAQGVVFLVLLPLAGPWPGVAALLAAVGTMALMAFGLTSLGVLLAWRFDSVQGFHAIMNLVLVPMWLLSGGVIRAEPAGWISWVMAANPLTYGVAAIRTLLTGEGPPLGPALTVTAAFALATFLLATISVSRSRKS